ncbi:MAG: hypothetical protein LBH90_09100 [Tannerella sp.]|nr:hypothetical protein [Tannerella sp.]
MCISFILFSCSGRMNNPETVDETPAIIPDYAGVTIPSTIAPLNFTLPGEFQKLHARIEGAEEYGRIEVYGNDCISIPVLSWHKLLERNKGNAVHITVSVKKGGKWVRYKSFPVYISNYPIDYGLVYRLIAPGYEIYSRMGIYQRDLSTFKQTAVYENTLIPGSCVNCHSFNRSDPEEMSMHIRGEYGGTILKKDGVMDLIDLKTKESTGRGVYPCWHPSGKYIAYSMNNTRQIFHAIDNKKIEVIDLSSDVMVYDREKNQVITSPLLQTKDFETFPAFSPDGRSLYFCLSDFAGLPAGYKDARYNLCRIDFDPSTGTFGNKTDTIIHASAVHKSVSFPRPSYDGKYIMYTLSDYGNFSIWHKEADLWLLNLRNGECRPLTEVNSTDTESYHSWNSNSRWFVFSSRRDDGLYTRLYLACMDEEGNISKPFKLPEEKPSVHDPFFYSFNVPEFITSPLKFDLKQMETKLLKKELKQAR